MKPMIKIEEKEEPIYLYEAISGNIAIKAEDAGKIVGSRKYQRWRPLTMFERIKFRLGLNIKNLEVNKDERVAGRISTRGILF